MSELFDAVDALVAGRSVLPPPAERERLRKAHGLTQEDVASALRVRRATVVSWESGKSEPRPPKREAYIRLLDQLAKLYPPPAGPPARQPAVPAPAAAPEDGHAPAAPGPQAVPARESGAPTPPAAGPRTEAAAAGASGQAHEQRPGHGGPAVSAPQAPGRPEGRGSRLPEGHGPDAPAAGAAARGTAPGPRRVASRGAAPSSPARPQTEPVPAGAAGPRFENGPLAVLDGDGTAYCAGGLVLECPAGTVAGLVEWALGEARLGAPRLHRHGRDSDPLVVLTEGAARRLGLPSVLEDRRGLRLPEDHPVLKELARAKWKLTRRGFGPWARVYRPARSGRRQCVQLAVLPWDALDTRAWGGAAALPPPALARVLADYAQRVITPRGSTAVNGLELMTSLRPPTRAVRGEAAGGYVPGPVPGSLTTAVDPAPPEAPDEHPVAVGRRPGDVLDEEACEWIRDPELLGDEECARPYAVGIDVNMAFAAAANRLTVGTGAPEHVLRPAFDKRLPGCWLVDLSGAETDPRLPNPFTPHGTRPEGPAWYATPTVAYAAELGHPVRPLEAWVRRESAAYLDPWYARLRDAYLATMERLGVVPGMDEAAYLEAMAGHKEADPGQAAVLSAVKATVKGGIGKLRERPQGARYRPGDRWPALERPTWRPDIRAAVIATARVNMHRKMRRLADAAGLFPIAVLSDCVVYLSDGPGPLDVLPRTPDGKPLPGGFRLGVSPGMVKHEGTRSLMWAAELLDAGHNPARHIKDGTDAVLDSGE